MLDAIYVLYFSRDLQLAPAQIATLLVVAGVVGVVGALVWPRLVLVFGIGPSMIAGDSLAVLGTLCIPLVQGPPEQAMLLLTGVLLVVGFAQSMMFIGGGTLRQAFSPPELIGRVSASITFVLIGVVPFGALLGGALGEAIGPRGALLVAGVGILLTPVWLLFSPVRSLRTLSQSPPGGWA
jgi:predicted MFS family arabinose efflux permease